MIKKIVFPLLTAFALTVNAQWFTWIDAAPYFRVVSNEQDHVALNALELHNSTLLAHPDLMNLVRDWIQQNANLPFDGYLTTGGVQRVGADWALRWIDARLNQPLYGIDIYGVQRYSSGLPATYGWPDGVSSRIATLADINNLINQIDLSTKLDILSPVPGPYLRQTEVKWVINDDPIRGATRYALWVGDADGSGYFDGKEIALSSMRLDGENGFFIPNWSTYPNLQYYNYGLPKGPSSRIATLLDIVAATNNLSGGGSGTIPTLAEVLSLGGYNGADADYQIIRNLRELWTSNVFHTKRLFIRGDVGTSISNVDDPINDRDAASKRYVDSTVTGFVTNVLIKGQNNQELLPGTTNAPIALNVLDRRYPAAPRVLDLSMSALFFSSPTAAAKYSVDGVENRFGTLYPIPEGPSSPLATKADIAAVTNNLPTGGAVKSVNGKVGDVFLSAADVGAIPTNDMRYLLRTDVRPTERTSTNWSLDIRTFGDDMLTIDGYGLFFRKRDVVGGNETFPIMGGFISNGYFDADGHRYPYPTGESSRIATLADITNAVSNFIPPAGEGIGETNYVPISIVSSFNVPTGMGLAFSQTSSGWTLLTSNFSATNINGFLQAYLPVILPNGSKYRIMVNHTSSSDTFRGKLSFPYTIGSVYSQTTNRWIHVDQTANNVTSFMYPMFDSGWLDMPDLHQPVPNNNQDIAPFVRMWIRQQDGMDASGITAHGTLAIKVHIKIPTGIGVGNDMNTATNYVRFTPSTLSSGTVPSAGYTTYNNLPVFRTTAKASLTNEHYMIVVPSMLAMSNTLAQVTFQTADNSTFRGSLGIKYRLVAAGSQQPNTPWRTITTATATSTGALLYQSEIFPLSNPYREQDRLPQYRMHFSFADFDWSGITQDGDVQVKIEFFQPIPTTSGLPSDVVRSPDVNQMRVLTQAEYDGLSTAGEIDPRTLYIITGGTP